MAQKQSKTARKSVAAAQARQQAAVAATEALEIPARLRASGQEVVVTGVDPAFQAPVRIRQFPYRRGFADIELLLENGQEPPVNWPAEFLPAGAPEQPADGQAAAEDAAEELAAQAAEGDHPASPEAESGATEEPTGDVAEEPTAGAAEEPTAEAAEEPPVEAVEGATAETADESTGEASDEPAEEPAAAQA